MTRYDRDIVTLHVGLVNTTRDAILVENEQGREVWLSRAALQDFIDCGDGTCKFDVTEHYATEKELV